MANLNLYGFYGQNYTKRINGISGIAMQLHITAKCDQKCNFCYMYKTDSYNEQIENELSLDEFKQLINQFGEFLKKYNTVGSISITGGDPILSKNFWPILEYINENYHNRFMVNIMGNPFHITSEVAKRIKELGVIDYQVSLDGLEKAHDMIRKPGSFRRTMEALKVLKREGINTAVSFTVSRQNKLELMPLYQYIQDKEYIDFFGFNRMIPIGNGENIKSDIFSPQEYRELLLEIYLYEINEKTRIKVEKKETLWRLLFWELGLLDPIALEKKCSWTYGCDAGRDSVSILADGTFLPCRRLNISSGKFPEKSFEELYFNNNLTKKLIDFEKYEKCKECEANIVCHGCAAMKYAVTNSIYGQDPYCWR